MTSFRSISKKYESLFSGYIKTISAIEKISLKLTFEILSPVEPLGINFAGLLFISPLHPRGQMQPYTKGDDFGYIF